MESSQGQDKSNNSPVPSVHQSAIDGRGFEPIQFFKKDKTFFFIHQKIEKLVAAMYMLTNFMSQEEPMKWSLRSRGIELLRLNIDLKKGEGSVERALEGGIREHILETVSLLEIATFSGLISEMNTSILKKEFYGLLETIQKNAGNLGHATLLQSPFFDVAESQEAPKETSKDSQHSSFSSAPVAKTERHLIRQEVKDKPMPSTSKIGQEATSQTKSLKEYGPVAVKKNKRQASIINLLKRKKEIMIKDVSSIIHECSEKTIQRELSALVAQGVLNKEGERRWTRYTLA